MTASSARISCQHKKAPLSQAGPSGMKTSAGLLLGAAKARHRNRRRTRSCRGSRGGGGRRRGTGGTVLVDFLYHLFGDIETRIRVDQIGDSNCRRTGLVEQD